MLIGTPDTITRYPSRSYSRSPNVARIGLAHALQVFTGTIWVVGPVIVTSFAGLARTSGPVIDPLLARRPVYGNDDDTVLVVPLDAAMQVGGDVVGRRKKPRNVSTDQASRLLVSPRDDLTVLDRRDGVPQRKSFAARM